jgi:hypothetical protein
MDCAMTQPRCEIIGDCTLWLGDAWDIVQTLPRADVLITDPPYGVEFAGKVTKYTRNSGRPTYLDTEEAFATHILPIVRHVLQNVDRAAIFCGVSQLQAYPPPNDIGGIVCPNGGGMSPWGFGCYNPVLFYGTSPFMARGLGGRPTATTMYHPGMHVTGESTIAHPCPKPLAFMQWLVGIASLPGQTVLDCFMGSGTTALACIGSGRHFVGIEIHELYFNEACRRIEAVYKQPDLFLPQSCLPSPKQVPLFAIRGA